MLGAGTREELGMLMLQTPRGGGAVAGRGSGMHPGKRRAKEEVRGLPF